MSDDERVTADVPPRYKIIELEHGKVKQQIDENTGGTSEATASP